MAVTNKRSSRYFIWCCLWIRFDAASVLRLFSSLVCWIRKSFFFWWFLLLIDPSSSSSSLSIDFCVCICVYKALAVGVFFKLSPLRVSSTACSGTFDGIDRFPRNLVAGEETFGDDDAVDVSDFIYSWHRWYWPFLNLLPPYRILKGL